MLRIVHQTGGEVGNCTYIDDSFVGSTIAFFIFIISRLRLASDLRTTLSEGKFNG